MPRNTEQELEEELLRIVHTKTTPMCDEKGLAMYSGMDIVKDVMSLVEAATRLKGEQDNIREVKEILLPHFAGLNLFVDEIRELTDKVACQICQLFEFKTLSVEEATAQVEANPELMESLKKGQAPAYSTQQIEPPYVDPC